MTQWMTQELSKIRDLIIAGTAVGAAAGVFITYFVTKALMATLAALLLAGAVVWGVANVDWFKDKVGQETAQGVVVNHSRHSASPTSSGAGPRAVVVLDASSAPTVHLAAA